MTPRLSVVIATLRSRAVLEGCLAALERCRERMPLDVVVVAPPGDPAVEGVSRWPWVEVIAASEDARFTRAANLGFAHARGDTILLLDPACSLSCDALERLVRAQRSEPGVAAVAPALLDLHALPQRSCGRLPGLWTLACDHLGLAAALSEWPLFGGYTYGGRRLETLEHVEWASSAALLVPRVVWEKVGGFDERIVVCMEEVDWCRRAAAIGHRVRYVPAARVPYAAEAAPPGEAYLHNLRSRVYYFRKHHGAAAALGAKVILWASLALKWAGSLLPRRRERARLYAAGLDTVWEAAWR